MEITIDASSSQQLNDLIHRFGVQATTGKELARALGEGGKHIKQRSKRNLQESMHSPEGVTGNLLRSYKISVAKGNTGVYVGFGRGGHHAHLVDKGHRLIVGSAKVEAGRIGGLLFHTEARTHLPEAAKVVINTFNVEHVLNKID